MPTGFTAPIYDGEDITFEQFANSCLRNFGIYLRFEGKYPNLSRYEIPDKICPSDYYKKKYEEAKAEYEKHLASPKTKEELEAEYLSYVNGVIKGNEDRLKENVALKTDTMECWQEIRKHEPFIKYKVIESSKDVYLIIQRIKTDGIETDVERLDFETAFEWFTFADGVPFGVKVEE